MFRKTFTTFVIPSIGRITLKRAIHSLLRQTDPDWKAVIMLDGRIRIRNLIPRRFIHKIILLRTPYKYGSAGRVRNYAIQNCFNTKWISFLDDDDTVGPNYVKALKHEVKLTPKSELILFRMIGNFSPTEKDRIIPSPTRDCIHSSDAGISFSINFDYWRRQHIRFINGRFEDNILLQRVSKILLAKTVISPKIVYFVRRNPTRINKECIRTILN